MIKLIAMFWCNVWRNFWSWIRWHKYTKIESMPVPEVNNENLRTTLFKRYSAYNWTADDITELGDSFCPPQYCFNENEKAVEDASYGKYHDDCFSGDTKVLSLDGNAYSFAELVEKGVSELWVYSCLPDGTIVPAKAYNPRKKETSTPMVKITLDNGAEIKCTEDHLFMMRDGSYKKAKDILAGKDSLMPGYMKMSSDGYLLIKDNCSNKFVLVHQIVNNSCNAREKEKAKERLQKEKYKNDVLVTHHKDHVKTNNVPENLSWETWREHADAHLIEYNKSQKHKETAKILGPINGKKRLIEYNQSPKHKETVADMNRDKSVKALQMRGRILKIAKKALEKHGEISEESYSRERKPTAPKYSTVLQYFSSYDELKEQAACYNHKIVSVEPTDNEPVYDITVPDTHNFLLEAGVFVHNCDGFHAIAYHILKNNGYNVALITVVTKPFTQSHTMTAIRDVNSETGEVSYRIVDYTAVKGPFSTLQEFVDQYNLPVRYWCLQAYNYDKGKYYNVKKKEF